MPRRAVSAWQRVPRPYGPRTHPRSRRGFRCPAWFRAFQEHADEPHGEVGRCSSWASLPLNATVARLLHRDLVLQVECLRVQHDIVRSKVPSRTTFTDNEWQSLVVAALAIGSKAMRAVVSIVKPETILRWQRIAGSEAMELLEAAQAQTWPPGCPPTWRRWSVGKVECEEFLRGPLKSCHRSAAQPPQSILMPQFIFGTGLRGWCALFCPD